LALSRSEIIIIFSQRVFCVSGLIGFFIVISKFKGDKMNNIILLILPLLLLVAVYVFVLTRKGEMQRAKITFGGQTDWITFIGVVFGTEAMWISVQALNIHIPNTYWVTIAIPVFLLVVFVIKYLNGKHLLKPLGDERFKRYLR